MLHVVFNVQFVVELFTEPQGQFDLFHANIFFRSGAGFSAALFCLQGQ
jgi:hypothetical protein